MQQNEFIKVTKHFIEPLAKVFNKTPNDEQLEAFAEDLGGYAPDVLQEAAKIARRKNKYFPSIYQAMQACDEAQVKVNKCAPPPEQKSHRLFHCSGHAERDHPREAREILSTPVGQLALKMGVGRELLVEYEANGRKDFDEQFVRKCKEGIGNAAASLAEARQRNNPSFERFTSMFNQMVLREKELFEKYYNQASLHA